jgi:predicted transcriptional regulator
VNLLFAVSTLTPILALLTVGTTAPPVRLQDQSGNARAVPDPNQALLLIYEDQDGGKQNTYAKQLLGELNAKPENRAKVDAIAVADLEKWNWWPAKKYALADVQKAAAAKKTTIYVDWKGEVRKLWGLSKAQNHLILIDRSGHIQFASQGELSPAQLKDLLAHLATLGVH